MRARLVVVLGVLGVAIGAACGGDADPTPVTDGTGAGTAARGFEPPVVTNAESPVRYPPALFRSRTQGTVVLRLFVTASGDLVPDSTRIAESSGHPDLDAAAVDGVTRMTFAPARRDGIAVATAFLQPVHFRHPAAPTPGNGQ